MTTEPQPTNDLEALAAKLEELAVLATPGDWEVEDPMDHELWIVEAGKQAYDWRVIAGLPLPDERKDIPRKQVKANADLIALLHNNMPTILTALRSIAAPKQDAEVVAEQAPHNAGNIMVRGEEYVPLEAYQEAMSGWKAVNMNTTPSSVIEAALLAVVALTNTEEASSDWMAGFDFARGRLEALSTPEAIAQLVKEVGDV